MAQKDKNAPMINDVLRTAAMRVTGENLGESSEIDLIRYAMVKTVRSDNSVTRRHASIGTSAVTPPNFYSPFTTASSFQIPNNRKEVYIWADWWYNNEPKVAAGINFYTDFPFGGFELECSNGYVKDYFEKLVKKLNFAKWLPLISFEYHLRGDVFPFISIDCQHCHGEGEDKHGNPCEHEGATWRSISILNPDMVDVSLSFLDQEPTYTYLPTEDMVKIVQERKPKQIFDAIPTKLKKMILARMPIPLAKESIWHFKRGAAPWQPFGTSLIRPLFPTLAYKDKLRQAQWLVAERHIVPIKLVKIGNDQRPASDDDIQSAQDELANLANDPLLTIVTHHAFEYDYVGASGKVLQLTNEYELIDQEIVDGLMLNKSIINGDGPSYSNAQVGLLTMAQRLERFRSEVSHWIEEQIFKPVAQWNGFTIEGKRGQEEIVYPTVKWDDLQLRDNTGKLQMMVTAQQNGVISAETLIEAFELDYDQEVERLRFEQAANFVNSPSVANTDIGSGYAGAQAGGMPPAGGAAGAPPMPGAPPMGGEGAAPMGGPSAGLPPMGGPMAAVKDNEHAYRLAQTIIYDLYVSRNQEHLRIVEARTASYKEKKKVLSEVTLGFLSSIAPVTGRGEVGPLPKDCQDIFPLSEAGPVDGGVLCFPMNRSAMNEDQIRGITRKEWIKVIEATDENGEMIHDTVAEFKAIPVTAGEEIFMPSGFGHLVANVGETYFATADDSPVNFGDKNPADFPGHADYAPVKAMQGFAYYVVEHEGQPALKGNPRYKSIAKEDLGGLSVID